MPRYEQDREQHRGYQAQGEGRERYQTRWDRAGEEGREYRNFDPFRRDEQDRYRAYRANQEEFRDPSGRPDTSREGFARASGHSQYADADDGQPRRSNFGGTDHGYVGPYGQQPSEEDERFGRYGSQAGSGWERHQARGEFDDLRRNLAPGGYGGSSYQEGRERHQGGGSGESQKARRPFRSPKGYTRSDERIREDVCDRLGSSVQIDPSEVEVSVKDGEVTLSGQVSERAARWSIEQIVDTVSGVKDIHNQLKVRRDDDRANQSGQTTSQTGGPTGAGRYQART